MAGDEAEEQVEVPSKEDELQRKKKHKKAKKTFKEDQQRPLEQPQIQQKFKKTKQVYTRVSVDPSRQYSTPDSRESWGPNVKGKKFRKEKGKKKRCPNAGVRIDGAINSIRLDA